MHELAAWLETLLPRLHPVPPAEEKGRVTTLSPELGLLAVEQRFWQYNTFTALVWSRDGQPWLTAPAPMADEPGATADLSGIDAIRWSDAPGYPEALGAALGAFDPRRGPPDAKILERARLGPELQPALFRWLAADAPHRHAEALALLELMLTYSGAGSRDLSRADIVPDRVAPIDGGWRVTGSSFKHARIDGFIDSFRDVTARLELTVTERGWNLYRQVIAVSERMGPAMT